MNPFRRSADPAEPAGRDHPRRELTPDRMPSKARALRGLVAPDVLAIAVEIHNAVADPRTGDPYAAGDHVAHCAQAFQAAWTSMQEDSAAAALPHDEAYRDAAGTALTAAMDAAEAAAETDSIVNRSAAVPSGAAVTRRQAASAHRLDIALARARERRGNVRHWQRSIERGVVLVGAAIYGLLDLFLLYVPILNLDFVVDSGGDVLRWLIGLVLAGAQALALDQALARHAHAERVAADLRDGIDDFNADVRYESGETPPALGDLHIADRQLRWAQQVLAAVAALTAVVAAWRVAALVRQGGFTVAEGMLFGSAVGLILGVLLLVLGAQMCRGNALGDRLRVLGAIVEETDHLRQAGVDLVVAAYGEGVEALDLAAKHRARGDEARTAVARLHWDGVQRAAILLGVDRPAIPHEAGFARPLPLREDADETSGAAHRALADVAGWLQGALDPGPRIPDVEPEEAPAVAVEFGNWDGATVVGDRSVIHGLRVDKPAPPRAPLWLIAIGAVLTVVAALTAAQAPLAPSAGIPATSVTVDAR